ncbi:hypothetical protein GUITHDRAFT_99864 [Guillardia theta CCMP2712]|uniref:DUF2891 domain-containing protein n=1 Tax=Guillardia theta (strain CCMP2712) TaxID=905079 RepID=L1K1B2_GUITC|nr:hypothetical protein GUITHDRAFT_99864 [Guillardia theta CCMP2712]EKX54382.1 hypothetical protein GUITHDRAFT_99864 [Guillardia theta CCMP2712]|eukprot:XP_005841362.1 hypothetical protein GUITHDRAFT_99864 [Guillardia theta CCMP2712]
MHTSMQASSDWAKPMAEQALSGLRLQYPHKVDHLWLQPDGPLKSPEALHPVFCGNYDWHSAVHSHWCLLRILRRHGNEVDVGKVSRTLLNSITVEGCKQALKPLTEKIRSLLLDYLPKLKHPVPCMRIFSADEDYNPNFEPSAEDFLSPGLCEMDMMRRLLPNEEFVEWASDCSILRPPVVADREDARLCHLDGLLLSKAIETKLLLPSETRAWQAWNLRGIAKSCEGAKTVEAQVIARMRESADEHVQLAEWLSPSYVGSHWLHSFALLAFDDVS